MAGALDVLLADWADRCRAAGGLVVGAHFPLPYAEIAADIVAGKIDALETQALAPGLDDPSVLEWYRFLNLGHRLPIVAGTDKMSSEVPIGAVRSYVHLLEDESADLRIVGRRRPRRSDVRHVRAGPGASRSMVTSPATCQAPVERAAWRSPRALGRRSPS